MKKNDYHFEIVTTRVFSLIFILYVLVACGPTNSSNTQSETSNVDLTPALLEEMNNPIKSIVSNSETTQQTPESTNSEAIITPDTQAKLNPPHGEPDHRCDIAVGAPLDSPVKSTASQTTTANVQAPINSAVNSSSDISKPVNASANASNGRVGPTIEKAKDFVPTLQNRFIPVSNTSGSQTVQINPPHGQPGHRCDIAVGDPLPTATVRNVKINPAHGQPGHRCDIPVGDPLPS